MLLVNTSTGDVWALHLSGIASWSHLSLTGTAGYLAPIYDAGRDQVITESDAYPPGSIPHRTWVLEMDSPTAVTASLVSARADSSVVHLAWSVAPDVRAGEVERRDAAGPWQSIGTVTPDGAVMVFEDRDVVAELSEGLRHPSGVWARSSGALQIQGSLRTSRTRRPVTRRRARRSARASLKPSSEATRSLGSPAARRSGPSSRDI